MTRGYAITLARMNNRALFAGLVVVLAAVRPALAGGAETVSADFGALFAQALEARGQEYVRIRDHLLSLGEPIKPALTEIAEAEGSTWQQRSLARALLARLDTPPDQVETVETVLATAILPDWARPLKPGLKPSLRPEFIREEDYAATDSSTYRSRIGGFALRSPGGFYVTKELLWKGLIANPISRCSVLTFLVMGGSTKDHEFVVGAGRLVFDQYEDTETKRYAVRAIAAHIGPARQQGHPVADPDAVIDWLASIGRDPKQPEELRTTVIEWLGLTSHPAAVDPALEFLGHDEPELRSAAVRSLGSLLGSSYANPHRGRIIDALGSILFDPDVPEPVVREAASRLRSANPFADPAAARQAADLLARYAPRAPGTPAERAILEESIRLLRGAADSAEARLKRPPATTQPQ
jgi:hypothetical protein